MTTVSAANTGFKNSVFTLLFSAPDVLRSLYSALSGRPLPSAIPLSINTLEDALFMGRLNDLSFEIDGKLIVLIEHQSTINPNMPLRCLLYVARLYEKVMDNRQIYRSRLVSIPAVECFVLYNGEAPYEEEQVLKLSDAFMKAKELGAEGAANLELKVKVININKGHNEKMLKQCVELREYSEFVWRVREKRKLEEGLKEAVWKAARECIKEGILEVFLREHSSEVINMLLEEWNMEDALRVKYEEGIE
ncbi:MAG: Rpn family recombination-promoting nuclease/putative transposase, partial [Treponema sp.]|nr:Rpn family recombination-promoting nuclease/putative transposase [Treponema sp.]